ncbi:MAG: hypothetical protein EOP86_12010 [Verrucomicrobiaceae bacterium]|nr:MAG: hypothetical protein EOP86_12010 [Verrucomicrobiaceae bacterium]
MEVPARQFTWPTDGVVYIEPEDIAAAVSDLEKGILEDRSLVITHPAVVDCVTETYEPYSHPGFGGGAIGERDGAWSFPHIMSKLLNKKFVPDDTQAGVAQNARLAKVLNDFMRQWEKPSIPGIPYDVEFFTNVINPWRRASGDAHYPPGQLAPHLAPLRLLAITNRIDLRENFAAGGAGGPKPSNAGRLHFIFGFTSPKTVNNKGNMLEGRLSVEIAVEKKGQEELWKWAKQWKDLDIQWPKGKAAPDAGYISALRELTESVLSPGSLASIRTNEKVNSGKPPWQMREFIADKGSMRSAGLTQTPVFPLLGDPPSKQFFSTNLSKIDDGSYWLPENLRAPMADITLSKLVFNGVDKMRRDIIVLNSCNGCHGSETGVINHGVPENLLFSHIGHRQTHVPSELSGFLKKSDIQRRKTSLAVLLAPSKYVRRLADLTGAAARVAGAAH